MYALITGAAYVLSGPATWPWSSAATAAAHPEPGRHQDLPLFGDGAGAVLDAAARTRASWPQHGFGRAGGDLPRRTACGSRNPPITPAAEGHHYMFMDGRAVFRWATNILTDTIKDVLASSRGRAGRGPHPAPGEHPDH